MKKFGRGDSLQKEIYFHKLLDKEKDFSIVLGELEQSNKICDFGCCRDIQVEEVKGSICILLRVEWRDKAKRDSSRFLEVHRRGRYKVPDC